MPGNEETLETGAVDSAAETLMNTGEAAVDAVERAAEVVGTTVTEAIPAQIVGAIDRIAATQSRIVQLVETVNNNVVENLNALSRAQANTDVSAQRAAESAGEIADALTPEKQSSPDQGQRPDNVEQLPQASADDQKKRGIMGFGKAASRHGKAVGTTR